MAALNYATRYQRISIHAPLAGCDYVILAITCWIEISIHAPLAGCDEYPNTPSSISSTFQSTHPLRGATTDPNDLARAVNISIHAPLAGCDLKVERSVCYDHHFNPRTPCGVRRRGRS